MDFKGFPVTLNLNRKQCLVIGGGVVAERKVKSLLASGADTTVISPGLTKELELLVKSGEIKYIERQYKPGDLNGYFLAVAATNDIDANKAISQEADVCNVLINVVDEPRLCTFFMPAIVKRGDLQLAISTNGKSPALAKQLRRQLEDEYGPEYALWLELINKYRRRIINHEPDRSKRRLAYEKLLNSDILEKIRNVYMDDDGNISKEVEIDKLIAGFVS